jgi:hypothetical protein
MMFLLMQELYASLECVYHVSERVFTISPVYTPSQPANSRMLEGYLQPILLSQLR